jgi:hypothetical protein
MTHDLAERLRGALDEFEYCEVSPEATYGEIFRRTIQAHRDILGELESWLRDDGADETALWMVERLASIYFPEES